ncbi:MAG: hypothetical protein KAT65_12805, partial [Methanophagales archaeon]|nr:hypothetical protein [Methanophagales archaeon]
MVDQAEIHRKVVSSEVEERREAAEQLYINFTDLLDKEQAWQDLIRLIQDKDYFVQWSASRALGLAFPHVPDKEQAWQDLHWLIQDEVAFVQGGAALALGTAFQYIPDKEQAWRDLIRLTQDEVAFVQWYAIEALGLGFPHVPDKKQAWQDLIRLTQDEDNLVQGVANHSLGRASIFKATETESEEDFREELKKALKFFETSLKESKFSPSSFCLPFYRSFYTITFEKAGAEAEVQKYLAEVKDTTEGSKSKEQLLEAVENLANALTEVQRLREANLDTVKRNLNTYRQYCDRAADLIGAAEEETPGAARILRRGLPIIDERIKEIIREIQEKAGAVCKQTRGTLLEELGLETTRYAQELPIQDPLALTIALGNMGSIASDWCEYIPGDKKIYACEQLKNLSNLEFAELVTALASVFEFINTNIHIPRIQTVHISDTQQEIVRLAIVQICFELPESFPFAVKNKDEVKPKIFSALNIASEEGANIVCLPELCLCEEWIKEIKEKYPDMTVIGGSFYKDGHNLCPVIMKSDAEIPPQPKMTPSASEYSGLMGPRMAPGDGIYKYETQFGKFVILICRDFDNFVQYFRNMVEVDMIFCPAFNPASERFHKEADVHVEKIPS